MKILLPVYANPDAKLILDFVGNFNWPPHACFKVIHVDELRRDGLLEGIPEEISQEVINRSSLETKPVMSYMKLRLKTLLPAAITEYRNFGRVAP